jgi:hypothetical protein
MAAGFASSGCSSISATQKSLLGVMRGLYRRWESQKVADRTARWQKLVGSGTRTLNSTYSNQSSSTHAHKN